MLQIYEKKLQQFQENLTAVEGSHHDWSSKQLLSNVETVKTDLDNLNRQYIDQVLWANRRLQEIKDVFTENNIDIQVKGHIYTLASTLKHEKKSQQQNTSVLKLAKLLLLL